MDTVAQWTEWFSALSLHTRTHKHKHSHTHLFAHKHTKRTSSLGGKKKENCSGEALSREGPGGAGAAGFNLSWCIWLVFSIKYYWVVAVPHANTAREHRSSWRLRRVTEIRVAATEHVAQSNQYFLTTAGRKKTSLINHIEFHSRTLGDAADFKMSRNKEPDSLYVDPKMVLILTYLLNDFFWDLLGAFLLVLHHLLLLGAAHPRCCYYCDIFPLHPRSNLASENCTSPPSPITVVLFDFLSGWLQSLTPCPSSTTLATKNPLRSVVMEMTPAPLTMEATAAEWRHRGQNHAKKKGLKILRLFPSFCILSSRFLTTRWMEVGQE